MLSNKSSSIGFEMQYPLKQMNVTEKKKKYLNLHGCKMALNHLNANLFFYLVSPIYIFCFFFFIPRSIRAIFKLNNRDQIKFSVSQFTTIQMAIGAYSFGIFLNLYLLFFWFDLVRSQSRTKSFYMPMPNYIYI